MKNLLPWDITHEHPVTILIFIAWHILRAVKKIHQLALIHEVYHSLGPIVTFTSFNIWNKYLENTSLITHNHIAECNNPKVINQPVHSSLTIPMHQGSKTLLVYDIINNIHFMSLVFIDLFFIYIIVMIRHSWASG